MRRVMDYTVDASGRVGTSGEYRIVGEEEWDSLQPRPRSRRTIYTRMMEDVCAGKIVAIPAPTVKSSWNVARAMRIVAQRMGVPVEIKRGKDPHNPQEDLVLVRMCVGMAHKTMEWP